MSERGQQLYAALKKLNSQQTNVYPAIVKKVSGVSVDVEIDGLLYEGVQLQANEVIGTKGILIKPSLESVVLVQRIMNANDFCIILYSDIDEVTQETSNAKVVINDSGIEISAGGENLLNVLTDLLEACINERHMTKSGPTIKMNTESTIRFENIKTRLKKLLHA